MKPCYLLISFIILLLVLKNVSCKGQAIDTTGLGFQKAFELSGQLRLAKKYDEAAVYALHCIHLTKHLEPGAANFFLKVGAYHNAAVLSTDMKDYNTADAIYTKVLGYYESALGKQHYVYLQVLDEMRFLYKKMEATPKLLPILQEICIFRKNRKLYDSAHIIILTEIGDAMRDLGKFPQAEEYYLKAGNILRQQNNYNSFQYLNLLNSYALWCVNVGKDELAEWYMRLAVQTAEKLHGKSHFSYASALVNLGRNYTKLTKYDKADSLFNAAREIYQKNRTHSNKDYAKMNELAYIDILLNLLTNYGEKRYLYLLKKEPFPENENKDLEIEQMAKKVIYLSRIEYGAKHPVYANALIGLANLYTMIGYEEEASNLYQEALAIRKATYGETHIQYLNLLFGSCGALESIGDIETAAQQFKKFSDLSLTQLKSNFSSQTEFDRLNLAQTTAYQFRTVYSFAYRNAADYPKIGELALNLDIATKALSLESSMDIKKRILESKNDSLIRIYTDWSNVQQKIAQAYTLTESEQKKQGISLQALLNEAYLAERHMANFQNNDILPFNTEELNFNALKKLLQAGERCITFLSFNYYNKFHWSQTVQYCAIIIDPKATYPIFVNLCTEEALKEVLDKEVRAGGTNYIADNIEAEALYKLVWEPLEPYLDKVKTVYLSPGGLLNKVAFGALLVDFSNESRLIDNYEIHYHNTLRDFYHLKQHKKTKRTHKEIALIGGVDFDRDSNHNSLIISEERSDNFSYLAGTQLEIDSIQQIFSHSDWTVLKKDGILADETVVKKMQGGKAPNILHIATHGFFFESPANTNPTSELNPKSLEARIRKQAHPLMRSGIALAGANLSWTGKDSLQEAEDGILTAYEVANLNLSETDLVVLSACETGRGDINNTEGVLGLQRAFKLAGVRSLIISLWKVPDKQTSELMRVFYHCYTHDNDIFAAFYKAQKIMRKKYKNPYYWAAFVLIE